MLGSSQHVFRYWLLAWSLLDILAPPTAPKSLLFQLFVGMLLLHILSLLSERI